MAQVEMPERKNMPVEYNDIPKPSIDYDTRRSTSKRSGLSKWTSDIATSVSRDIIKPTIKNLTMQAIDLVTNTIKSSILAKLGGGAYSTYSRDSQDWTSNAGFNGNANYNPNRFNINDGYVHNQAIMGVVQSAPNTAPWRDIGFRTLADLETSKMDIIAYVNRQGYIRACQFGHYCHQSWDYSLNNYGWTAEQLKNLGQRYNMAAEMTGLPYEFLNLPDPIYLNSSSNN